MRCLHSFCYLVKEMNLFTFKIVIEDTSGLSPQNNRTILMSGIFHPVNYKPFYCALLGTIFQSSEKRPLQRDFIATVKQRETTHCFVEEGKKNLWPPLQSAWQ